MQEVTILVFTALSLGFLHTLLGPDHYLPFIVLSKARSWSQSKTMWITFASGLGHVGSSVLIGLLGIGLGTSLLRLEAVEANRADVAAWMVIGFGLLYSIYGIWHLQSKGKHVHLFSFFTPRKIKHSHGPAGEHTHEKASYKELTPWILFLIFVFGPCEVLIPMLIFPASQSSGAAMFWVILAFALSTVLTMMIMVYVGYKGLRLIKSEKFTQYFHLLAGMMILFSGIGIKFLGL